VPLARPHLGSVACGTVFRRIEEVIEDIQYTTQTSHLAPEDMPEGPTNGPARPLEKKREEYDTSASLRNFRRIQLIRACGCRRVIEKYAVCGCTYVVHEVDACTVSGQHTVVDMVVAVGYTCPQHTK